MNIKVLQWLLAHRELLLKIVDAAKDFSRHKPYMDQWEVVDRIARLVIPVLSSEELQPQAMIEEGMWTWDEENVAAFSAGAEVHAMGVDWKSLIEVILPLVVAILQALASKQGK